MTEKKEHRVKTPENGATEFRAARASLRTNRVRPLISLDKGLDKRVSEILDRKARLVQEMVLTSFVGCSLIVRHDPDTARWVVALVSRTGREDVPVAWKATEADAAAWAANYGMRK